jgi:hypothetical protein
MSPLDVIGTVQGIGSGASSKAITPPKSCRTARVVPLITSSIIVGSVRHSPLDEFHLVFQLDDVGF